jgi:DnaK suppressor protein
MNHLTPTQIAELREELERQLAKLEKSMAVSDEAVKPVELDQTAVGRLSRMDSLMSQGMARGLQEREVARFAQLREAVERMNAGEYGVCEDCGSPIAFERLYVFPESPTCAACSE